MSQPKGHFESYPTSYYTGEMDNDRANIERYISAEGNQRNSNPSKFYNPHAGQIIQKRDPSAEHYDGNREGYYSDPDMEAQFIYPNMNQNVDYHGQIQNMNYYGASPNIYARSGKSGSRSPFIVSHQMQFGGVRDYHEQHEPNRQNRHSRYYRQAERDLARQYDENSDFDEKEAQMFSIKEVKKSDYIRGSHTSVSYAQIKELQNIQNKFEHESDSSNHNDSDLLKTVRTAISEIEELHKQSYSEYPIDDFVGFVKTKFTEVFLNNRNELEDITTTPIQDLQFKKFKDTDEFDSVKGRLDFKTAIDDLTKNYEWLKDKSYKAIENLEQKYEQIVSDLEELNNRVSSYSVLDNPNRKDSKMNNYSLGKMKDTENKIMLNVIEDMVGHVGYTYDSVAVVLENSMVDLDTLKEAITEYNELLESKIKKLPNIISTANLKTDKKQERGNLYDLYVADPERSEKSETSRNETGAEAELKKDIQKLSSQLGDWRKNHKSLFDAVHENHKLQAKLVKTQHAGVDAVNILKSLLKDSNRKVKDLLNSQYPLHYNKSRKARSNRDTVERVQSITASSDNRSTGMMPIASPSPDNNNELVSRINILRREIEDLRDAKNTAERVNSQNNSLKADNKKLQDEYDEIKEKLHKLRNELSKKEDEILELNQNNDKLSDKVLKLKTDYSNLEQSNKDGQDANYNILRNSKRECENQILSIETNFDTELRRLRTQIDGKDKKLIELEDKLNTFKSRILTQVQQEAQKRLSQKVSELQQLTSKNKDMKSMIEELTNDKEMAENKLKRNQSIIKDLKQNLKQSEDEKDNLRKSADEQTTIANSLYEDRLNDKNIEINDLSSKLTKKDSEISTLKEKAYELDTKLVNIESKLKEIHSLADTYKEQVENDTGRTNPTVKIIVDELESLLPGSNIPLELSDKAIQVRELLKEKNKLEDQIEQLKWDIDKEIKQTQKAEQEYSRLQKESELSLSKTNTEISLKSSEIEQLKSQIREKDEGLIITENEKGKLQSSLEREKELSEKLDKVVKKYRAFALKVCQFFDYQTSYSQEEEIESPSLFKELFEFLHQQKRNDENDKTQLRNEIDQKSAKILELNEEIADLKLHKEDPESDDDEKQKIIDELEEKRLAIASHTNTLESMRSTILKLRDNLQKSFDENEKYKTKLAEYDVQLKIQIEDQKISVLSTLNSHFIAVGITHNDDNSFNESNKPSSDVLFSILVSKIQNSKHSVSKPTVNDTHSVDKMVALETQNKQLSNEIRDFRDKLELKEKDFRFISQQRDNLRQQLESAVEYINLKESTDSPKKSSNTDVLPSIQSQLQILQDESKQSEAIRDITEQLIENFERNDRLLRERLDALTKKCDKYKQKLKLKKEQIKELKSSDNANLDDSQYRAKITIELKKKIREEEIGKRDREIERQRKVMSAKSEEQAIQFNQKVEELEAKFEAKDEELTDLLIKLHEAEHEIERLKHTGDRKSGLSLEDQLDELNDSPRKSNQDNQKRYDNHMKILEKVEKLDGKIMELTEHIARFRIELGDRIEGELEEINNYFTSSTIIDLGDKTFSKLQKMKESNVVIQIVRKIYTEGFNWLLLEKKDPLDKPLELKTSTSLSKSSMEIQSPGKKFFWVCEEALKDDMLEYVYSYTPKFLLDSKSLNLEIGDLFNDESDYQSYKLLKDTTKEFAEKRLELIKEQREIKLSFRRENFLLKDIITTETEEHLRELEHKNIEFEEEIQMLSEENTALNIKNKELYIFINLLNIRLKEMNQLVYDFARDKSTEEYVRQNANLIRDLDQIKSDKMMLEAELKKYKDAIERQKCRKSRPDDVKNRLDAPNSPDSFIFDGENELFGDSFIIDTSNKEMEDKLERLQNEIKILQQTVNDKQDVIERMQKTIDELEIEASKQLGRQKSESFEMMNSDNIKHIKDVLFKFLKKIPFSEPNNEALLDIVFSMLHMKESEIKEIKESRIQIDSNNSKNTPKKSNTAGRWKLF